MADDGLTIEELGAIADADITGDCLFPLVDPADQTESPQGTTKKGLLSQIWGIVTDLTISGKVTLTAGISKLIPGATSFSLRNHADSADNVLVTDAGVVTVRDRLTAKGLSITNGTYTANLTVTGIAIVNDSRLASTLEVPALSGTPLTRGLNLGIDTSTPTTPQNGDLWFDGSALKVRIGGVNKTVTVT